MLQHLNFVPTKPNRVVVLGSQGFVGSHITRQLVAEGVPVLALSKDKINLLEANAAEKLLGYLQPEDALIIVSAIAPCKNAAMLIDNLKMVQAVCEAIEKTALSQVIYISSDAVYADDVSLATENSAQQPSSFHGMMHSARELMLKASAGKIPFAILRPSLLYGLEDPHNGYGPNRFRRLAIEGKTITLFGNGEEKRDHVFIEDVAKLVSLALHHRSQGALNIATGESVSFRETAEEAILLSGNTVEIQATPRQNPITHRHFDIAACYKAFPEFHYTSFKQGIGQVFSQTKEKCI